MSGKKYLINKLLELPEITKEEYLILVKKRNNLLNNNTELSLINEKINLYNLQNLLFR